MNEVPPITPATTPTFEVLLDRPNLKPMAIISDDQAMENPQRLISLVYLSAAVFPFSQEDLLELLEKCRANNSSLGVSGMLLFKENNFLQLLEGENQTVMNLFKKITRDPRHRKLTTLSHETISNRDFSDWSMGFHDLGSPGPKPAGFTSFLESCLTAANFKGDPSRAKKLLLLFKEEKLLTKGASD